MCFGRQKDGILFNRYKIWYLSYNATVSTISAFFLIELRQKRVITGFQV